MSKDVTKDLDIAIEKAMKKLGVKRENDICRYLPGPKGGYMHHFTKDKKKNEAPQELLHEIEQFILHPNQPQKKPPKPRAPRGSRKRTSHLPLSKQDIELLVNLARRSGEKDILRKLAPRKDLRAIKRELIASIKQGRVEEELWFSYVESNHQNALQTAAA
jgi:hypothetical protein